MCVVCAIHTVHRSKASRGRRRRKRGKLVYRGASKTHPSLLLLSTCTALVEYMRWWVTKPPFHLFSFHRPTDDASGNRCASLFIKRRFAAQFAVRIAFTEVAIGAATLVASLFLLNDTCVCHTLFLFPPPASPPTHLSSTSMDNFLLLLLLYSLFLLLLTMNVWQNGRKRLWKWFTHSD